MSTKSKKSKPKPRRKASKRSKSRRLGRGVAHPAWRILAARALLCFGLLLGMLLSANLWSADRLFPVIPVLDWIVSFPAPLDRVFFYMVVAVVALMFFLPGVKMLVRLFLAAALLLALQDQMRWQPWFYQYVLSLLPFAIWKAGHSKANDESALAMLRMIMIAIYFWGGAHKLGSGFIQLYNDTLLKNILAALPEGVEPWIKGSAYAVPWLEMGMAVLLLFVRTRFIGVVLITLMHLWILVLIGPWGLSINSVVWPWNLIMIGLVWVLFYRVPSVGWERMTQGGIRWIAAPVALLVLVMPGFSSFGLWDRCLSFHLYSGRDQRLMVEMSASAKEKLGPAYEDYIEPSIRVESKGRFELDFLKWSLKELNVPTVSEDRILLKVSKQIANAGEFTGDELFFYRDFPQMLKEKGWDIAWPDEIRKWDEFQGFRKRVN